LTKWSLFKYLHSASEKTRRQEQPSLLRKSSVSGATIAPRSFSTDADAVPTRLAIVNCRCRKCTIVLQSCGSHATTNLSRSMHIFVDKQLHGVSNDVYYGACSAWDAYHAS
jgi:hypothetical protein